MDNVKLFLFNFYRKNCIVLGIPLLSRIYQDNWDGFMEYALLIAAIYLMILLFSGLTSTLRK